MKNMSGKKHNQRGGRPKGKKNFENTSTILAIIIGFYREDITEFTLNDVRKKMKMYTTTIRRELIKLEKMEYIKRHGTKKTGARPAIKYIINQNHEISNKIIEEIYFNKRVEKCFEHLKKEKEREVKFVIKGNEKLKSAWKVPDVDDIYPNEVVVDKWLIEGIDLLPMYEYKLQDKKLQLETIFKDIVAYDYLHFLLNNKKEIKQGYGESELEYEIPRISITISSIPDRDSIVKYLFKHYHEIEDSIKKKENTCDYYIKKLENKSSGIGKKRKRRTRAILDWKKYKEHWQELHRILNEHIILSNKEQDDKSITYIQCISINSRHVPTVGVVKNKQVFKEYNPKLAKGYLNQKYFVEVTRKDYEKWLESKSETD